MRQIKLGYLDEYPMTINVIYKDKELVALEALDKIQLFLRNRENHSHRKQLRVPLLGVEGTIPLHP
jgi:hypothetical protein